MAGGRKQGMYELTNDLKKLVGLVEERKYDEARKLHGAITRVHTTALSESPGATKLLDSLRKEIERESKKLRNRRK